ncbi:MAG: hypothetical protein AB1750_09455 [Chloroflexota bacterium]
MRRRPVALVIAVLVGVLVLAGFFIPPLAGLRATLIQWGVVTAGVAVFVGVGNLFSVHFQKIRRREKNSMYSLLLLVAMLGTLFVGMFDLLFFQSTSWMQAAVDAVIVPVEASMMALLAVTLVYASIRLLRRRADWMTIVFLVSAVLTLAASVVVPLIFPAEMADAIRSGISLTLAGGGARGLVLGVALGALTTGLRVLLGMDRPYGGK